MAIGQIILRSQFVISSSVARAFVAELAPHAVAGALERGAIPVVTLEERSTQSEI